MNGSNISSEEQIIMHIFRNRSHLQDSRLPFAVCKEGIGKTVGISNASVSIGVRDLQRSGLLFGEKRLVETKRSPCMAYFLTPLGIQRAKIIESSNSESLTPIQTEADRSNNTDLIGRRHKAVEMKIISQEEKRRNNEENSRLRDDAAEQLGRLPRSAPDLNGQPTEDLVHELQVHQIELEMQAEELRRAHLTLKESRDRYLDLYEFAPIGYLTLTDKGLVIEVNLTGATLLDLVRNKMVRSRFSKFVAEKDVDQWHRYFMDVLGQNEKRSCTLTLKRGDGSEFPARLEAVRIAELGEGRTAVRVAISDISDIRLMEDALRESEARYRAILDQAADAVIVNDLGGRIIDVNQKACRSLGYGREELLSRSIRDIDPDAIQAGTDLKLWDGVIADGSFTFESRHRRKDGSSFPVEETLGPVRLPTGPAILAIVRDITKRKRVETYHKLGREVLQTLNQPISLGDMLQQVIHTIRKSMGVDAVGIRMRNKGDFPYYSQEGFSKDFLTKENSLLCPSSSGDFCRDVDGKPSLDCTCGLVVSGRTDPSNPLFTRGGSAWTNDSFQLLDLPADEDPRIRPRNECVHQGYASIALIPIRGDNEIVGLLQLNSRKKGFFALVDVESLEVIMENIGMAILRKRAEDALTESENRYHLLVDSADEGIVVAQDGMLRFVNPATVALTGFSEQKLKSVPFLTFIDPEDRSLVEERYQKRSRGESVISRYVFRLLTAYGVTRWVEMNAIAIEWDERPATLNFLTDVTGRLKAEEDIKRSNTELQQFAFVASHDLQEPLRMVVSYLTLLEKRYGKELDQEAQEFIQYAVDGGWRMRQLIDDLLEYSRVETKGKELELVDMNEAVESTLKVLSVLIEENKAEIIVDNLPTVFADKMQVVRVFQNLIENALKFRGKEPPKIYVSAVQRARDWTFEIKDNGIGFDMQYASKIFLMFQRLHTRAEYPGTGIGLAIVKKIIERHGGTIWTESEEGKGTSFFFTIPKERVARISELSAD